MTSGALRFVRSVWPLTVVLAGCGGTTRDAPSASQGTGGGGSVTWPQRVVLHTTSFEGEGLRLADATVLGSGAGARDLWMDQSKVASLGHATPESFCEKGTFDTLAEVPIDDACASDTWTSRLHLSAATVHTNEDSYYIGLSALVKDASHTETYRLRILGDEYDAEGDSSVTFEYELVAGR
jgi:hypothetical protein